MLIVTIGASLNLVAEENDIALSRMKGFVEHAVEFGEHMPPEKVFVHLDNTSYFRGDKIWFQCYVLDGLTNTPTILSKTVYVELLTPGGKVVDRKVLKVDNGRSHGCLSLSQLPFYSGFYEVRAYTRYMMNFGEAAAFSRVIPVFDAPRKEGEYTDRHMTSDKGSRTRFDSPRPVPVSSKLAMRFFPEGGRLVDGVLQRVAFEFVGKNGLPLDGYGYVLDERGDSVSTLKVSHEGRGVFEIMPVAGHKYKAVVSSDGKEYTFTLPQVSESGVALTVDNLSSRNNIAVSIRKCPSDSAMKVGVALTVRGSLWSYAMTQLDSVLNLKFDKQNIPSGVAVVTLFRPDGSTIADRMVFVDNGDYGRVTSHVLSTDIDDGNMTLELDARDLNGIPASVPLSVSVTDGDNSMNYGGGILPELLLMSEVKGYIRNPAQYFTEDGTDMSRELDLLMMVQGWRCYSWEEICGVKPLEMRYYPEQGVEVEGQVVSFVRGKPKPGVTLSAMMKPADIPEDSIPKALSDQFTTDSIGKFRFICDVTGRHRLVMSVTEKGKKKDHRILFDRLYAPSPRAYNEQEMRLGEFTSGISLPIISDTTSFEEDERIINQLADTSFASGNSTTRLAELVVKGKRDNTREAYIYEARSKAVAHYDIVQELSDIADKGKVIGQDIYEMLLNINHHFFRRYENGEEVFTYKDKPILFVVDYEPVYEMDSLKYKYLYLESIKSIYITEDPLVKSRFVDPAKYTAISVDFFGGAVFIETDPDRPAPPGKGTRRVTVEGYCIPEEFRNADASDFIDEEDYRRTLYWNPLVQTGRNGKAWIKFYNKPSCRNLKVSVQGVDEYGRIFSD